MTIKYSNQRPLTDEEEAEIQKLIANDPDAPEATDDQIRQAKPFMEAFPDLADSIKRSRGRPRAEKPLQQISIRLETEVIAKFRGTGKGWQARINDVLKQAVLPTESQAIRAGKEQITRTGEGMRFRVAKPTDGGHLPKSSAPEERDNPEKRKPT